MQNFPFSSVEVKLFRFINIKLGPHTSKVDSFLQILDETLIRQLHPKKLSTNQFYICIISDIIKHCACQNPFFLTQNCKTSLISSFQKPN